MVNAQFFLKCIMRGMMYKAIIFDYFGVLSSEVGNMWLSQRVSPETIAVAKETYMRPADKGIVSEEVLFKGLSSMSSVTAEQVHEEWLALAHLNMELLSFIQQELAGKYKLGLLTNATPNFFHTVFGQHPLAKMFDAIVVSSEIGHAKPDPEAYAAVLRALHAQPADAFMIDDTPANIEGAKAVGLDGWVFSSNAELKKVLGF